MIKHKARFTWSTIPAGLVPMINFEPHQCPGMLFKSFENLHWTDLSTFLTLCVKETFDNFLSNSGNFEGF